MVNLQYIAARRIELGLTLQEMAEALGFKYASTYFKYERGEYKFKASHLPILAQKLDCSMDDMFDGDDCRGGKEVNSA